MDKELLYAIEQKWPRKRSEKVNNIFLNDKHLGSVIDIKGHQKYPNKILSIVGWVFLLSGQ